MRGIEGADGRASLRISAVEVRLSQHVYTIPALPASRWLPLIAECDWFGIVPGLIGDCDDESRLLLESGGEMVSAARDAVEVVCGMRWWAAARLAKTVLESVDIAGALVCRGVLADSVSVGAFVAATYFLLVENCDQKGRARVDSEINRIPPGVKTRELYDPVVASRQFERFMSSH